MPIHFRYVLFQLNLASFNQCPVCLPCFLSIIFFLGAKFRGIDTDVANVVPSFYNYGITVDYSYYLC